MPVQTYAAQLEAVQAAIAKILTSGQDVSLGNGRRLVRADLDALYRREQMLMKLVDREARGGGLGVAYITPE